MTTTETKICAYCHKTADPMGYNPTGKYICGPCIFSGIENLECWHCHNFKTVIAIDPYTDQICTDCLLEPTS
jgi:recombinational DNA repair protein (RecF pathway)